MKKENANYSIGLDIGTNSVGWAVTDSNYQLLKWKGKNMWGARLFDKADTAKKRRISRSTRRRYNKRRERIYLLRTLMNQMVMEVDSTFFIRLEHTSFLNENDKKNYLNDLYKKNYNLFIEEEFNDKEYYKLYPTIYHLREHLCQSKERQDPRLIYLALHHIVKYRGNFLYEGQNFNFNNTDIIEKIDNLFAQFFENNEMNYVVNEKQKKDIMKILQYKTTKKLMIENLLKIIPFEKEDKMSFTQLFTGLVGNSFNVVKMTNANELVTDTKEIKFKFSDSNFDEQYEKYENELQDEVINILDCMKSIYSWMELQNIIGETDGASFTISSAMVDRYKKHQKDLQKLKKVIKEHFPNKYFDIFKSEENGKVNYYNYIHHPKEVTNEQLCNSIKKILIEKTMNMDIEEIINDIDRENFLLKQNDKSNGSIPYQMQLDEMKKILDNQSKYYPDLKNNYQKIISILTFKIPYYYGPLNGPASWIIKNMGMENERITPWNHSEIVDIDKTSEKFITRMTNFCTYFVKEPVLPKNSLLINKYEVLSELNKIRVNDKLIPSDTKNQIIEELFMTTKKVTDKTLRKWFFDKGIYLNNIDLKITGYQKDGVFASSLSSWIDFKKIFGIINKENYDMIENIIYDITIFEDKKILKRRLQSTYKGLSLEQLDKIVKLRYSGWSRLSKKLLNGITSSYNYKMDVTIIELMEMSNYVLMEIINDKKMSYKKTIEDEQIQLDDGKFKYDEVAQLAGSPAIKKGIWQALLIIDEIKKVMKCNPMHIYIEMAREEGKKQRTLSSVEKFQNIYKEFELQSFDLEVFKSLNKLDKKTKITSDRLYLYYTQMGKCMYTGAILDIDKLELYEIDHIVPQSLIKDDSLDNRVLVLKKSNQLKADNPVIDKNVQNKMFGFWQKLYDNKLISSKKYFSLIKTEYNENEKSRFINRQLVETRQIIKHVATIVNNHYHSSHVVIIRAGILHDFRIKYKIRKNRNINDYHHAHDAYIACLLGTYIFKRFPKLEAKYIYGEYQKYIKVEKNRNEKDGFILNSMNTDYIDQETGEIIWQNNKILQIKKYFEYSDCFITRKLEEFDGQLFNLTARPNDLHSQKGVTIASIPLNKNRPSVHLYGGFEGVQYFPIAIEGKKKDKLVRKIVGYPIAFKNDTVENMKKYIFEKTKLEDIRILNTKIYKNQLLEIDRGYYYLTAPNEVINATQLLLANNQQEIIYQMNLYLANKKYDSLLLEDLDDIYISIINKINSHYPSYCQYAKKFEIMLDEFKKLELNEKCKVIEQMLILLQANAQNGKIALESFFISNRIGRLGGKTINLDETYFIRQSITGLYNKKYKL